jgi:hypothetical protein
MSLNSCGGVELQIDNMEIKYLVSTLVVEWSFK